ncbi:MAG: hypothetical protein IKJ22_02310 [Paludibacteraceae bacterium]|nr:hypothetical protein [Paludibacteraceae bacterium]
MKNFTNNFKQFTARLSARWLIMALMLLVGTSSAWAQKYNYHWKGKVYFVAPETWDLTNYSYVQVNITRTTSATASNHQEYVGSMTRLGTSRMYYLVLDANHSNWGQNEYLAFTANDHAYNSGSFALNGNHYYTKPISYDCNNSDNYYLFKPNAGDNYNTVTGTWGENRDILKAAQTVQICTNGNSSASGGKVTLKGYYFSADNSITQSTATSTSATETYNGAVIGSEMTLTASANTGYEFDGWYNAASDGTLLSSSATYTYNVYGTKTIYARFTQSCTPPDAPFGGVAQSEDICTGSPYTFNSDYKWYTTLNGSTTVSGSTTINANTTYYIAKEGNDGCESTRTTYTINVNPIPSFSKNPTNKSICEGDSEENLTTLSGVTVSNGSPVWYNVQTGGSIVNKADLVNGGTYWVAAENATTGCKNATRKQFVLTVNSRPAEPSFDAIAACGSYTLPTMDNQVNWYTDATDGEKITSVNTTDTYYAEAVDANNCTSTSRTSVQITINPKPSIGSIAQSVQSPVPFEDVVLTANNVTDGAQVKWYVEENLVAENTNTYTVTSETAGDVIVKAKAFLGDCESDFKEHEVTFREEDCTPKEDEKTIEIWCRMSDNSDGSSIKCYGFGAGDFFGYYPGSTANNGTGTYDSKTYQKWKYTFDSKKSGLEVIFNTKGDDDKTEDISVGSSGKRYYYWYNKSSKTYGLDDSETIYTPAPITDPAVKTVSVETEPGEGNIIFSGQVVKTGCANALTYGFAYSTDANADKSTWTKVQCTNVGNTVGTQFSGSKTELENGTYYVCAYITNSAGTTYGTVTEVSVSTVKTAISNVAIKYSDIDGKDIDDPNPMCKGATAYVKLSYVGSKYSDIKWLVEGVETDDVTDEGDGVWSYEVQGDGSLSVELKNDANTDPAWPYSNKLLFTIKPEPIAPTISLDKSTLCSNDDEGATISLGNTVVGQTYSLFKEIENDDDTQIGNDIECTEQNKESISFNLKGLDVAGRYYVIAKENVCNRTIGTTSVTLEVVNTTGLSISIEPNTAVVTPWEPVKLKITATEGYQYNVTGLDGMVYTVNGDTYTVKIPLPEGGTNLDTDGNVVFKPIKYTISATLITGGDNQCIDPATCTITLTPYLEPCTQN